ncbi:MAG: putative membrane protein [uncultured archaeon A07HR60]|nr:MAG: putative membrane protein [uncultured archaeon A07HR60]
MSATQGDLAALSRVIFRAPSWYSSVLFTVIIAALAGIASFDSRFILEDAWMGIFFIAVPTVIASGVTPYIDGRLGGRLSPDQASLLALVCELLVVGGLVLVGLLSALVPRLGQGFVFDVLFAALAAVFGLRLLVVMAVSHRSPLRASIPASVQTVSAGVLLFVYTGTARYLEIGGPIARSYLSRPEDTPEELLVIVPSDFLLLGGMCLLYAGAVIGFIKVIDRPWQRSMEVSVLDFLRGFVGYVADGTTELEEFFEAIGQEAVVPVTVLSFRGSTGEKARFVLPMVHPGPMGEIGGGNLPAQIASQADGLAFPPHATAGHDFNLVTSREVETLLDTAADAMDDMTYRSGATESVRHGEGEATLLAQAFGDSAFVTASYAPAFADDVEYAVGLSAAAEARHSGLETVMLADAHNCSDGLNGENLGHVVPGSKRSFDLIEGAGQVGETLADAPRSPLRMGVAWDRTSWDSTDGIGPLGVRVAVTEVGDQQTAYVLVDGNNMEPGLRDTLVDAVQEHVTNAEILTTDTHVVNSVDASNQVGERVEMTELRSLVVGLLDDAIADLEPVEAGMVTNRAEVTVFGNDRTESLASHANAMIQMGGALAVASAMAVTAISVLLFLFT